MEKVSIEQEVRKGDMFCIDIEHDLNYEQNRKLEMLAKETKMTRQNVIKGIVSEYLDLP